jgi:hypothetical protein
MRFTPGSVSDVLEWIELFSASTGLPSTTAALIHAELCHYPTATILFLETSQLELTLDSLEKNDEEEYEEKMSEHSCTFDEFLEELDEDAFHQRTAHYAAILKFHGFTDVFMHAFLENLSPSSESHPERVEVEKVFEDSGFNDQPVFVIVDECFETDDDEDESEPNIDRLRSAVNHMLDHQRLERPVNPAGWVALMARLGFKIVEGSVAEEYTVGVPSFFVDENEKGHIPVFIVGAIRTAFDDEDEAGRIMKVMVQSIAHMNHCSKALLFYGSPSVIADDNDMKEGLVFWGEVFAESAWGELILHQDTHTVDRIIADSKVVTRGLESFDKAPYRDKGLALMSHWMEHHVYTA